MSVRVEPTPLGGGDLARSYVSGDRQVRAWYRAGPYSEIESYRSVAARVREATPKLRWTELADAFRARDPAGPNRMERLAERNGLFVVTGQQAGLFTGPLLTLYKALSAVRLAERLEEELEVPIVPLFWVASEDHDWQEVNHTNIVDLENELRRIEVAAAEEREGPGSPVHRVTLGPDIEDALDELAKATPDTEFKESVLSPLRRVYRSGHGFTDAFEEALASLVHRFGLVVVQASHPFIKGASRELLWVEWQRRSESATSVLRRTQEIEEAGYSAQVSVNEEATNLFIEGERGRDRVLRQDDAGLLRSSGARVDSQELRRLLDEAIDRVSAGALLGPVVQASVLPTVAHVVGPGEIGYLAQSQVLFELHGVPAPVVVPRASFRLLESRVAKVLEKYDIGPSDLADGPDSTVDTLVRRETPRDLDEALESLRAAVGAALGRIESAAVEYDPGSRSAVGSGRHSIFQSIDELERKLEARMKEKHAVLRQQVEKAATHLFPEGREQERVLNVYPYLVRYGTELLDRVHAAIRAPV